MSHLLDMKTLYKTVFKIINSYVIKDSNNPLITKDMGQSVGTGFFIENGNGLALTAAHVIENSTEIWINMPETGEVNLKAKIISVYPDYDLAVIKVDIVNDSFLDLGNSDSIKIGDDAYTIGYPNNPKYPILTKGTISGMRDDYLQVDTPLNHGNSGGPLMCKGKVIGVNSAVIKDSENSSLIVPIDIYKNHKGRLYKEKIIYKCSHGLLLVKNNPAYRSYYNIDNNTASNICNNGGVIIKHIYRNSPLKKTKSMLKSHIKTGDVICSISIDNNSYLIDMSGELSVKWNHGKIDIIRLINNYPPGKPITINFWSISKKRLDKVTFNSSTLDKVYPIKMYFAPLTYPEFEIFAGLIIMSLNVDHIKSDLTGYLMNYIETSEIYKPRLLISHIYPNTYITEYSNFRVNNFLTRVNNKKVTTIKEFITFIKKPVIKNGIKYIILENSNSDTCMFKLKDILEQEEKLSVIYNYEKSSIYSYYKDLKS
tara:strand:+ start:1595 stop:3043 length:1449 start_codon:yes stop_codon:yes gene_type:complete